MTRVQLCQMRTALLTCPGLTATVDQRLTTNNNRTQDTRAQQDDTTYDIYLHDERTLEMGTNLENAFINNARRRSGNDKREFDSFSCDTPPGYEESLYRQRILKLHNR